MTFAKEIDFCRLSKRPKSGKENMTKQSNSVVYFEIPVKDIHKAMRFYENVFGFEFDKDTIDSNEMAFFPLANQNAGISGALANGEIYKPTMDGVCTTPKHLQRLSK